MSVVTPIYQVAGSASDGAASRGPRSFVQRVWTTVAIIGATTLIAIGVWAGRSALLLIYISLLTATGLLPIVQRLERLATARGGATVVPRGLLIATVYALFVVLVIGGFRLVIPPLVSQSLELRQTLPSLFDQWQTWLLRHGWIGQRITFADAMLQSAPAVDVNRPIALAASAVRRLAGGAFSLVTVLILTFYILLDGPALTTGVARALPLRHRARFTSVVRDVTGRVSAWLQGNLILASIMGALTATSMAFLGEPFFYIVALLAAGGEFVPIAGPLLAGVFAVLMALTVSVKLSISVGIAFLALHEIDVNVLMPRVMARQVGLSSLAIFVAVLIGAEWFGLAGALLAIPTTAMVSAIVLELRTPRPDPPAAA